MGRCNSPAGIIFTPAHTMGNCHSNESLHANRVLAATPLASRILEIKENNLVVPADTSSYQKGGKL